MLEATAPTVLVLIDQGAHMNQNFAGVSTWEAVTTALFDAVTGVAWAWEDQRAMGLATYTSFNGGAMCPVLSAEAPALVNAAAMEALLSPLVPEDENPTGESITAVSTPLLDGPGRRSIVLITGRNPDTCATPNPQNGGPEAVAAVTAAQSLGIDTLVVDVGSVTASLAQELADVGIGLDPQGQVHAPFWTPANVGMLTSDLDAILAGLHSCVFDLNQDLPPGGEFSCTVDLDGQPVALDDPDGWQLLTQARIEFTGAACRALIEGAEPLMSCGC
ncbi:MAG: hypothetical protein KC431_28050 [Myxococcales bacterium]|nr:hypothetical protein [Myxococcales bacterium]MCA9701407.1 hypothetical protein [Myxococcales bacterium]